MKLNEFRHIDLDKHPQNRVPNCFMLEFYPDIDAYNKGNFSGFHSIVGDHDELIPGLRGVYSMTDHTPPLLAFMVRDYTTNASRKEIAENVTDPKALKNAASIAHAQNNLMLSVRAPDVASATAASLLARVVESEQMDILQASETMMHQFDMGFNAAKLLMTNAVAYVQQQKGRGA